MRTPFKLLALGCLTISFGSFAQGNSQMVEIAADTLSNDLQEDGLSIDAIAAYNRGLGFAQAGQNQDAIIHFNNALSLEPVFPKALYNRAAAKLNLTDYTGAISDLNSYLTLADTATIAHYFLARAYHLSGEPAKAAVEYGMAIDRKVRQEESYLYRAEISFKEGNYKAAEADYSGAIFMKNDNDNAIAFHDRGSSRKLLEDMTGATDDYNRAIQLDPRMAIAYVNLGSIYRKQEKFDKALSEYNQALRLDASNVLALNNRGYTHFLMENYERASDDFLKAIALNEDYAYAYNNLASVLIKQEKYKDAIDRSSKAISLDPNYGFAYLNRGIAREMIRDIPGACADWKMAESLNIQNAKAYQSGSCQY